MTTKNLFISAFLFSSLLVSFMFVACNKSDEAEEVEPTVWEAKSTVFTLSADVTAEGGVAVSNAISAEKDVIAAFLANKNSVEDPGIAVAISKGGLNPVPTNSISSNLATTPDGGFFENVNYKGAFGTTNWATNWTLLSLAGYFPTNGTCLTSESATINVVEGGQGNSTGTTTWSRNTTYILKGHVFVNNGEVLTIEAGTVIKGKSGEGEESSALIVARGGKIIAEGTAEMPIIFTSEDDLITNGLGSVSVTARGKWGGLIILGKGILNSSAGETAIEGIPTSEPRGIYGGNDNNDNSGILKYVSIRHGGSNIGEGNEINGLTLGAVGSSTNIEYVEVISNKDDGVEFFGGAPELKHIVVAFCADDSFDYDEGYSGKGQFWFAVQDPNEGDRIGEHDGGTDPETGTPYAKPVIYNATYIGRGEAAGKRTITFRDNAGGTYANSIFINQQKGIDIELLASGDCSYTRLKNGDLVIKNNVFFNVAKNLVQ